MVVEDSSGAYRSCLTIRPLRSQYLSTTARPLACDIPYFGSTYDHYTRALVLTFYLSKFSLLWSFAGYE